MLEILKNKFSSYEILKGNFGIERETLRVHKDGKLAMTPHPNGFGPKMANPYITTDFSESQIELITPSLDSTEETYKFLNALYDIADLEVGDEYLWPQSMPCDIPDDEGIPIASYCSCEEGKVARAYREKLLKKYGGKKQLISGIHYNFSLDEEFLKKLYNELEVNEEYKVFKNNIYLKIARNYLKYRWLLIYLLSGTAVIHESFNKECVNNVEQILDEDFSMDKVLSYRNSQCGYGNKIDLYPEYTSIENYVESIESYIKDGVIDNHKELYSQIRLKASDNNNFLESLKEDGVKYVEIRSIDINPFEKCGISLMDLDLVHMFIIFLLVEEEDSYKRWQEEALYNQRKVALYGRQEIELNKNGEFITKTKWALEIINRLCEINETLNLGMDEVIISAKEKVQNPSLTYASKISEKVKKEGFISAHLDLSKEYKKDAYNNRYKLEGYEDLELSTQILLKEAIKSGIEFKILDRKDNFILLDNGIKKEYIKQATKTSLDSYINVLMMENKVVTKKVLEEAKIRVPKGYEFNNLKEAMMNINKIINKPIVIKPKSTNFGLGISIFKEGTSKVSDLEEGLKLAFSHDETVLVEEFIKGKEYRFLVIGDEVLGILHRVPANVLGNGKNSIKELVEIKNTDPLRGKGYKTPLEKINIDKPVELFLNEQGLNIDYIPKEGEVIYLRENSNISTGGDSIDYTDLIPDKFKDVAVKASKAIGAEICGVDMMLEDYSDENTSYGIIELNFNPAIHIHSFPYKGLERNIAKSLLKLLDLLKINCNENLTVR